MSEQELGQATVTPITSADVQTVMTGGFYNPQPANSLTHAIPQKRDSKPSHYKVICISMYTDDLRRLDSMVEALKARGLTKANRSALIRYALGQVDLDRVPKGL